MTELEPVGERPGESGMAAVIVLLMGFSLLLLTSVVVFRSVVQSGATGSDARWEQALYTAESGLNIGALTVSRDPGFATGETAPSSFSDRSAERAWVVAAADARPEADLIPTPEGEFVMVRPSNSGVLYSVGYVPSRDDTGRRVRVVRADIDEIMVPGPWELTYALLSGGDLEIEGNPTVISATETGVHANGHLTIAGSVSIDSCTTAAGGFTLGGQLNQGPGCAYPGTQDLVDIPDVSPRQFWHLSEYDLCPNGAVRAGPAHPTQGNTVANEPCTGAVLTSDASTPYRGWKFNGCCDSKLGAKWVVDSSTPGDGVYYVYRGSIELSQNAGTQADPWEVTILIEGQGSCPSIVGGDLYLSGNPVITPHHSAEHLLIAAGRDLEISGTPNMYMSGLIAAYEQIKLSGNPEIREGGLIAQNACDSSNDNIHFTEVSGNVKVTNTGPIGSPFSGVVAVFAMANWDEM